MNYQAFDPFQCRLLKTFPLHTNEEISLRMMRSETSFFQHKLLLLENRLQKVAHLGRILHEKKDEFASLISLEMGKPLVQSVAEVEKSASLCEYYSKQASSILNNTRNVGHSKVLIRPLGVVLGIMPWNFPFWQVVRFAVPALCTGNTVLLKHAPNVPQCALALEQAFQEAGFDNYEYQNLFVSNEQVTTILAHKIIAGVSLTGSEMAGRAVAQTAGYHLKPQLLELGGSDPFIVMPSSNLELAVKNAVASRLVNGGQSCVSAKRFIIHEQVYDAFVSQLLEELNAIQIGDPLLSTTQLGPLARIDLVQQLESQVQKSLALGADLLFEKKYHQEHAAFAPLRVLANIQKGMPAYKQELFGPVFSMFKVSNMEHALQIANDSSYGLASSVWTNDEHEKQMALSHLEAGAIFFNSMVKSDASLPFGGVKNSGYGREMAQEGLLSFCNITTVVEG